MSGAYPSLLRKRSLAMLRLAEELLDKGEYDLAALNAEYAVQLYVKQLLYRVTGEEWRGHGLRMLLGTLSTVLRQQGFPNEADKVADYVRSKRRLLAELEEAHVRAVYGAFEYSREQAQMLVETAKNIISTLGKVEGKVVECAR